MTRLRKLRLLEGGVEVEAEVEAEDLFLEGLQTLEEDILEEEVNIMKASIIKPLKTRKQMLAKAELRIKIESQARHRSNQGLFR